MPRRPLPVSADGPKLLVCVTGSRHWPEDRAGEIRADLETVEATGRLWGLVEGGAPGADQAAGEWAKGRPGVIWERFPADWGQYGRAAGPLRNRRMLAWMLDQESVAVPLVLAYPLPDSRGTWDMVGIARGAGVRTVIRA